MDEMRIIFLFIAVTFISCNSKDPFVQQRMPTARSFLNCLVNEASKLIRQFGLPAEDKWIIKHDPGNNFERLVIIIPLFKGHDTASGLKEANILLTFPPAEISDKIYQYEVNTEYDPDDSQPVLGPKPASSYQRRPL